MGNNKKSNKGLVIAAIVAIGFTLFMIASGITILILSANNTNVTSVVGDANSKGTGTSDNSSLGHERVRVYKSNDGVMTRFIYEALVEDKVSIDELSIISEGIVRDMIEERLNFQALAIHFYTHKELINYPPALGIYIYAPDGEWGNSGAGKADFSNFKGNKSGLSNKDWEMKPTSLEIEMYDIYSQHEYIDDGIEQVANQYNISFEEARDCINKVNNWIYK